MFASGRFGLVWLLFRFGRLCPFGLVSWESKLPPKPTPKEKGVIKVLLRAMVVDNLLWRPYFLVSQGGFEVFAIARSCVSLSTHWKLNIMKWWSAKFGGALKFLWVKPFFGCARNLHWWVLTIRRVSKWRPWVIRFGSLCWIAIRLNHLYSSFLLVLLTSKQLSSAICMTVMSENVWIACNILEPHFAQRFWSGILRISRNGNLLQ